MNSYKRFLMYAFLLIFYANGPTFAHTPECNTSSSVKALAKSNNVFAVKLYQQLRATEGNLFFSPYSIRTALAMTYAGAKGSTAAQMKAALILNLDETELHKAFADSIRTLNTRGKDTYEMIVSNSLWGDTTCKVLPSFLAVTQSSYNGNLKKVDFIHDSENARIQINAWVEKQTRDKIENLIPSGGVTQNTRLALVNAVYFKGFWAEQFDKKLTRDEPFYLAAGSTGQTKIMRLSKAAPLPFYAGDGIKIVELDYRGDDISMVIILPDKADGLSDVEARLNEYQLNHWLGCLKKTRVQVYVPRFTMHWGAKNIVPNLRELGMHDAFIRGTADFSGIDGTRKLLISSVFHKAFVDVNEEGTEAAAATGVMVGVTSMPPPAKEFRADHPFLFLIHEKTTGSILFMGRMTEPANN